MRIFFAKLLAGDWFNRSEGLSIINERAQCAEMAEKMGCPEVAKAIRDRGMTYPLTLHPLPIIHVKH